MRGNDLSDIAPKLPQWFPSLNLLLLEDNRLSDWDNVSSVTKQFAKLEVLNLSNNQLKDPPVDAASGLVDEALLAKSVYSMSLNGNLLESWATVGSEFTTLNNQ